MNEVPGGRDSRSEERLLEELQSSREQRDEHLTRSVRW